MKRVSRTGCVYCGMGVPSALLGLFEKRDEIIQFRDRRIDIMFLCRQQGDALAAALDGDGTLGLPAVTDVVQVDHLANLGEAEADTLATQDPGEPRAIA